MEISEFIDKVMVFAAIAGIFASFRYLDNRARARKKFRKPKYKQYKIE